MWRWIPHPGYGNYGGRSKRCENRKKGVCPVPVDGMDMLFQQHDTALHGTKDKRDRKLADKALARGLWQYEGKYARPVYGRLYRFAAFIIFKSVSG